MKLSDYVAQFLAGQGIKHVFAVSGGASLHLIHSLDSTPGLCFICPQHEQAGAMAADGYARVTGNLGAAMATSGPGATNMITGVCCSYYDSVPVIFITGQVSTFRMKKDLGVRQIGFQETATIEMYRHITKYAVLVNDPKRIRFELEKACAIAREGRPGPVLVDIPDNIQRESINPEELEGYVAEAPISPVVNLDREISRCLEMMSCAQRPVIVAGWGIHLANAEAEFREFVEQLGFPMAPTWAAADLLPHEHPMLIGTFGTHGTRFANFAIQNADLIISLGSRLDTKSTGSPITTFAREARKIVVDIDGTELGKFQRFGLEMDLLVPAHAKQFLKAINPRVREMRKPDVSAWVTRIAEWKRKYPVCLSSYYDEEDVNPYVFVKELSRHAAVGDAVFIDTGCSIAWMMQGFECKEGQRLYHDFNNTAMGWALPASIGASFALPGKSMICVTGDGSLQMNIQELATVIHHKLPIKIFLLNNHGHSMIQQTQDQWLGSKYLASSVEGGLASPDFVQVARAYGFPTWSVETNKDLPAKIRQILALEGPAFLNVEIRPERRVVPQVKYGRPNEDSEPLLERKEFLENMIVKPMDASLKV